MSMFQWMTVQFLGSTLGIMNVPLGIAASKLRAAQQQAYFRRVMWLSFEERLKSVFVEIDSRGHDANELWTLYLSFIKSSHPAYRNCGGVARLTTSE